MKSHFLLGPAGFFRTVFPRALGGVVVLSAGAVFSGDPAAPERPVPPVVPLPAQFSLIGGPFVLPAAVALRTTGPDLHAVRAHYADWLTHTGFLRVADDSQFVISLVCDPTLKKNPEAYELTLASTGLVARASGPNGVFYALQTLRQLARPDAPAHTVTLPACTIQDAPRFGWRGMHLDVSRHFQPKEFIKRYLDLMALYKLNVFHWHLVDGPGWRIEIKKYPKLTQVGAWREDKTKAPWSWKATHIHPDGKQEGDYGGFYTQDDIREIVRYAADRFITIVPEIEMPGHSYAALVAYPEYACEGVNVPVDGLRGQDVFCVGHPGTIPFFSDILDEVLELFPSKRIHIGADEVSRTAWKNCPRCRALMKKAGLETRDQLQSHFVRQMETYLDSKGRILTGWDEIMEGGLAPRATVMVWRDTQYAKSALQMGHPVVLCPTSHCYFDYYQGDPATEPPTIGGMVPLEKVYSWEPEMPGLSTEQKSLILGAQGNVWTEYIQTADHVEYMVLPRLCALAEVVWSDPARKNYESFRARLRQHRPLWDAQKLHYRWKSLE